MAYSRPYDERRAQRAAVRRRILIQAMGGCCELCGDDEDLQFHHIEAREWIASKLSAWDRQDRYEAEWAEGKLQLLCGDCNKAEGQPTAVGAEEVPF